MKRILFLLPFCAGLAGGAMAEDRHTLTLKTALQNANSLNLKVVMADARLQQAIARISRAQSGLLPHIEGDMRAGRQTADLRSEGVPFPGVGPHIGPYNNFDVRGRVTLALFDAASFQRFKAAKKEKEISGAELEKTREDVLALVAQLFVEAQRKQQTAKLFKTLWDKDHMAYELGQSNLLQGTGTLLESNRYKSEFDHTKYLYLQARLEAEEAFLDLKAALQMPPAALLELADDADFITLLQNDAAVDLINASSADMALAWAQLESSKAYQNQAYADFLPKISGSADYGRSGESPSNASNTYGVGVKASIPIWEGGEKQAQLKEAKGQVKEAQANFQDAAQQQQINIAKARAAIAESGELVQARTQKRQTFQDALQIALRAQQTGSGSSFQVMEAKANLAQAEDEYNEARAAWIMSHIQLLHAEGRLRDLIHERK